MTTRGHFSPQLIALAWFDEQVIRDGWVDDDLVDAGAVMPRVGFRSLALLEVGGIAEPAAAGATHVHLMRGLLSSNLTFTRLIA